MTIIKKKRVITISTPNIFIQLVCHTMFYNLIHNLLLKKFKLVIKMFLLIYPNFYKVFYLIVTLYAEWETLMQMLHTIMFFIDLNIF